MRPPSGASPSVAAPGAGVVVPIRAFTDGMARLAGVLTPAERAALGRDLATRVVTAAAGRPTVVVTSAPEVRAWADDLGIECLDDPGSLDAAARIGAARCAERGITLVTVLHADLPRISARAVRRVTADATGGAVTIAPCRRADGTPALTAPVASVLDGSFAFAYGPGSFRRHAAAARAAGLGVRVVRDLDLAADLDLPEDLEAEGLMPTRTTDVDAHPTVPTAAPQEARR